MKQIFHSLVFFLATYSANVGNSDGDRPDLFLDGGKFADHVTLWVLSNYDKEEAVNSVKRKGIHSLFETWLKRNIEKQIRLAHNPRHLLRSLSNGNPVGKVMNHYERQNKALLTWIETQPKRSVTPLALFKKALIINNFIVEDALVTAWNVLSNGLYNVKKRNYYRHTRSLVDITGENNTFKGNQPPEKLHTSLREEFEKKHYSVRPVKFNSIRGDNFSAWYHFFGTALLTYSNSINYLVPLSPKTVKLLTQFSIFLEENIFYADHVDPMKRIEIDKAGVEFGSRLSSNFKKYSNLRAFQNSRDPDVKRMFRDIKAKPSLSEYLDTSDPHNYLHDRPDIYGEKWHLKPAQEPWEYQAPKRSFCRKLLGND